MKTKKVTTSKNAKTASKSNTGHSVKCATSAKTLLNLRGERSGKKSLANCGTRDSQKRIKTATGLAVINSRKLEIKVLDLYPNTRAYIREVKLREDEEWHKVIITSLGKLK